MDTDAAAARLARALAHPARIRILRILLERTECVCGEICDAMPLAQSTVSQHLRILSEAGLVRGTVDGPRVCYCADPSALRHLRDALDDLLDTANGCCGPTESEGSLTPCDDGAPASGRRE